MSRITALETWLPRVEAAAQALGLDPGPVDFRLVPAPVLYEAVAYHGLGGYGHWTRGRDYWRTKEQLDRGRGRRRCRCIRSEGPTMATPWRNGPIQDHPVEDTASHVRTVEHSYQICHAHRRTSVYLPLLCWWSEGVK